MSGVKQLCEPQLITESSRNITFGHKRHRRRIGTEQMSALSSATMESRTISKPSSVKFRNAIEVGPWGNYPKLSNISISHSQQDRFHPKPNKFYNQDLVYPNFNGHTYHQISLWFEIASKYTAMPIFTHVGRNKTWCTNLGESSLR